MLGVYVTVTRITDTAHSATQYILIGTTYNKAARVSYVVFRRVDELIHYCGR